MGRKGKNRADDTTSSSSSLSSSSDDSDFDSRKRHRHRKERRNSDTSSRKDRSRKKDREDKRSKRDRRERERKREREREIEREIKRRAEDKRKMKKRRRGYDSGSDSGSGYNSERKKPLVEPRVVVEDMLNEFPNVGDELKQLLQMIDSGQAVDIKGISERSLIKHLKKLFVSLNLKEDGDRVFSLPVGACSTLDVVGPLIQGRTEHKEQQLDNDIPLKETHPILSDAKPKQVTEESHTESYSRDESFAPRKRVIGPEIPSAELLAAAAKLTEAQAELREAELEEDDELFIGPPPPAVVAEVASANEAERFEEVTRIMGAEADSPYDIVGVNHNMSADNLKKRYWKLSLMVHPDKCSHPQAHQAFILLNKAFKELQDPDKRKVLDDKIKQKEEQEKFKVELRAMREAAQWRRSQGISMEGDDELLADMEVKVERKRDDWMTTLPPERKPGGVTMQSTTQFSKTTKEGRGDASVWTDTPSDRAQKAKMNYLEAYNEAAALALNNEVKRSEDADLVDKYNKERRSKSLVEKHQEKKTSSHSKRKKKEPAEKEEWKGQHPWKPWDREKDLVGGRQNVKLDSENMAQGLTSRFSSGSFQRNFL